MFEIRREKAVAGLTVLMGVISMLFVIGIILMAFMLTGAQMYDATTDTKALTVINSTMDSLDNATDFFPIYITVAAIVVVILLIVLIFGALRGSGMMGGGA